MMALSIVAKATVLLVLAFAALRVTRQASASLRSLLLATIFAILLALPLAATMLPGVSVTIPVYRAAITREHSVGSRPAPASQVGAALATARSAAAPVALSATALLTAAWLVGFTTCLIPIASALWRTQRMRSASSPWPEGGALLDACAAETGVRRQVGLLSGEAVVLPMTCGVIRPVILLPADAPNWSEAELRHALVHELEHVRRHDWIVLLGARAVCAIYWFHPLVWMAWRRLRLETERACDDAVLRGAETTAYAEQLVALARRVAVAPVLSAVSMASRSDLAARIAALLDPHRRRSRAGRRSTAMMTAGAVLVLVALASLQAAVAQDTSSRRERTARGTGSGTVSGVLYDPFGKPIEGVRLGLEGFSNASGWSPVQRTDARGRYRFAGLPAGVYALSAPTTDFVPYFRFGLTAGQSVRHDLRMKIEPFERVVTVCAECPADTYEIPDSLASELAQDRETEVQPARGAEPEGGLERYEPAVRPYPPSLTGTQLEGLVVVEGRVGADGLPRALWVVSADHPDLGKAAIEMLEAERWEPAHVRGVRVDVPLHVTFEYVLRQP